VVLHASAEVSVLLQGITRIDRLSAAPLRTLTISGKLKPVSHSADCTAVHPMHACVCVCVCVSRCSMPLALSAACGFAWPILLISCCCGDLLPLYLSEAAHQAGALLVMSSAKCDNTVPKSHCHAGLCTMTCLCGFAGASDAFDGASSQREVAVHADAGR